MPAFVNEILDNLKYWEARNINKWCMYYKILHARMFPKKKMNILFSPKDEWEESLRNGFKYTNHEVTFGELATENIRDYDLVVPLTISALKYLTRERHLIVDNPIPIPSYDSVSLCDDKILFNRKLSENGFGDLVPRMGPEQNYPYILKKAIDGWGKHSYIIADRQREKQFSDLLENPEYFCQEFISGENEYATHLLFKNQKIVWSLNIEYWFKMKTPIKGKDETEYRKICRCPYLSIFASVLTFIGFEGLCCINYKIRDNHPLIMEINPRFGGSLCPYFFSYC